MNASVMIQCYGTVLEMLADRGEDFPPPYDLAALRTAFMSESTVDDRHAAVHACTILKITPKTALMFYRSSKIRVADVDACVNQLGLRENQVRVVVVLSETVNQIVTRQIASALRDLEFELWSANELRFNFSRHGLVPKHELLAADEEVAAVLAEYRVPSSMMFPLLSASDMMARYLLARPGNLMRITRTSPSAGVYVVYRRVV